MRFAKGMDVLTAQGEKIGTLRRVVIDAKTRDVTDIVVDQGMLAGSEKVIPVGLVDLESEDQITLRETNQGVDDFMNYETTHYIPLDRRDAPFENIETSYWYPPTNLQTHIDGVMPGPLPDRALETESSIPEGRVTISQGAQVISADDKHVGNVEQVIVDSENNNATHLVVGKGFLLKEHKLVPVLWVTQVGEDKVYLSVEASLFDRLPDHQGD